MGRPGLGATPGAPQAGVREEMLSLLEGMSIVMAAERGTAEMYRRYGLETQDSTLKKQWERFGGAAQTHLHVAEGVITALRGEAGYQNAGAMEVARCTETMLSLAIEGEQADLLRLSHLVGTEQVSLLYWRGVSSVASRMKDPALTRVLRQAATTIERDKNQHVAWNSGMLQRYVEKVMSGT